MRVLTGAAQIKSLEPLKPNGGKVKNQPFSSGRGGNGGIAYYSVFKNKSCAVNAETLISTNLSIHMIYSQSQLGVRAGLHTGQVFNLLQRKDRDETQFASIDSLESTVELICMFWDCEKKLTQA